MRPPAVCVATIAARNASPHHVTYYVTFPRALAAAALLGFVTYYVTNPPAVHATVPWTLAAALQTPLENNPDARIARHQIAGARAVEQQARAMMMPQVSISGAYTRTNSPMTAFGSILNQRAVEAGVRAHAAAAANARARFAAGQRLKTDLLSLEVQLAQTRENLINARHGPALAERAFLFVLGVDSDGAPLELIDDDPALPRLLAPESTDFSRRPELPGLRERTRVAPAKVRGIGFEGGLIEARMRHGVAAADERIAIAEFRRAAGLEPLAPNSPDQSPSS